MQYCGDITSFNIDYDVIKTNKKIDYLNLSCGFDIETSSVLLSGGVKAAFMYVWAIQIGVDEPVIYGRTWEELVILLERLSTELELFENRRLVIYVHNLGYEFQFMRKYFTWLDVFSLSERNPLKALCDLGIEFRCSYKLSGFSLDNTAKNLVKHRIKKLTGTVDYDLIRTHDTILTAEDLDYVKNDVQIVTAYIDEQIDYYKDITKIPMTNTGRVRSYVRQNCYYTSKNHRKTDRGKYFRYRKIMEDLTLTPTIYAQLKRAFMGGFTHANARYAGKVLENVSSIDFTSSYPAVMVSEKFPMSRFKDVVIRSESEFNKYCSKYAMIFDIRFTNIKAKINQEVYLSESKCISLTNPSINNGRVFSADELVTTITEVDLDIMKQVYSWDSIELANVKYAHKGYLPKAIIESILNLYQDKTVLKDVQGQEVEYMLSKGMLNSIYGMCVTDVVKNNAIYTDDWSTEIANPLEVIDKYNTSKTRFLYYPWGVWVTAYARRNLWTGILAIGDDYVYSDTDSLKLLNYENHKDYIDWYDSLIIRKMTDVCNHYKFNPDLLKPKTKDGVEKMLGVWDFEGTYSRFKTLGAKRYLVEENSKLQLTVAGLSKQNGVKYMLEQSNNCNTTVFNMFDDSLYIPASETGKNTHTYIDNELKFKITDYQGNDSTIETLSSIHLEPCDFTLSISKQYNEFLRQLSKGYIFKGLQQI